VGEEGEGMTGTDRRGDKAVCEGDSEGGEGSCAVVKKRLRLSRGMFRGRFEDFFLARPRDWSSDQR